MATDRRPRPQTRYVRSGDASIAYQVLGHGPLDVVMVPGFPSHLELAWEHPRLAYFYNRLASFSRLILLDKRGIGLSDRVPDAELPGVEQRTDDLRAVLDAVESEDPALVGISDGGPLAAYFAATHPDRARALVIINTFARRTWADDYPWAPTEEQWEAYLDEVRTGWGGPVFIDLLAPGLSDDPDFAEWWAMFLRQSVSPGGAIALLRMNALLDVRAVLPAIHAPTLVFHRVGDRVNPIGGARYLAAHIPQARLVELEGEDHHPWNGDAESVLTEVESFLTGSYPAPSSDLVLATVLFTDIVGSTETAARLGDRRWQSLLETHDGITRLELQRFGGREVKTTGDGFLAVFGGPAKAIRCALAIRRRLQDIGIEVRAGAHTSEVQLTDGDVRGVGVHVAARLTALARPGEVMVSSVVRDLAVGSGLEFLDRGRHRLRGVPGDWQAFSAQEPAV